MAKQPERQKTDGPIGVSRTSEGRIRIDVTNDGEMASIEMSEFNARRAFGILTLFLGIRLPRALAKKIDL